MCPFPCLENVPFVFQILVGAFIPTSLALNLTSFLLPSPDTMTGCHCLTYSAHLSLVSRARSWAVSCIQETCPSVFVGSTHVLKYFLQSVGLTGSFHFFFPEEKRGVWWRMNAEERGKVEITRMEYTPTLLDRLGSVKEMAKSKTVAGFCRVLPQWQKGLTSICEHRNVT